MTDFLLRHAWPLLASVAVKSLFVPTLAVAVVLALRRSSAAARHLVWRLALFGLLLLPAYFWLPAIWQVPLAPRALLVPTDAPIITPSPLSATPAPNTRGAGTPFGSFPATSPDTGEAGEKGGEGRVGRLAGPGGVPPLPVLGDGGQSLPWPLWLCGLWLTGCVLTLLPTVFGLAGVGRLARRSLPLTGGPLPELTASLTQELGVKTPVRLLTGEAGTPMTWGWLRPIILLPPGADGWPTDRLRAVLLHELAHIARADWPAQIAAHLACSLYWFNPLVWLAARQARLEGERACDDRVLLAGIPARDYARHLIDVARSLRDTGLPTALSLVNAATLKARLQILLDTTRKRGEVGKWMRVALFEVIVLPVFWFSYLVVFTVPLPPNRAVRLDPQSYQVISQANAATAGLHSLWAHIHETRTIMQPWSRYQGAGTVILQKPNFARVKIAGYDTFTSDGSLSGFTNSAGKTYSYTSPVDWDGDNIMGPGDPFLRYFFQPDYYRLGADYTTDVYDAFVLTLNHESPVPVVGRYLGVQTWQGARYQVVLLTRSGLPYQPDVKAVTWVYVGKDRLVHRIINRLYSISGVVMETDDVFLTDLQTNHLLPNAAFQFPAQEHPST